jgi:general secretion pathway protein K
MRARERGIALIVVLWVLALLTVLVVTFSGEARTDLQIARNQNEAAQARAIADAGVTMAILRLFDPSPATQWTADGQEHPLAYGGGTIGVRVQDEAGKIDLNYAPAAMVAGLFETLGIKGAEGLADAVLAWRGGAGGAQTVQAGANGAPRHPFLAVDELRLVPGMTRAIYDQVTPFVTVYSNDARINPLTAPAEVLRSVPGATAQEIANFLAARAQAGTTSAALPAFTGMGIYTTAEGLRVFTVTSQGLTATGIGFTREAVAVLTGVPEAPCRFLSWRELHRLPPPETGS